MQLGLHIGWSTPGEDYYYGETREALILRQLTNMRHHKIIRLLHYVRLVMSNDIVFSVQERDRSYNSVVIDALIIFLLFISYSFILHETIVCITLNTL